MHLHILPSFFYRFIEAAVATINARLFLKLYATPHITQEEELYLETRDLYYTSTDDGYSYTATLHDGINHLHSSPSKTKKANTARNGSRGSSMNKFRFGSWGSETYELETRRTPDVLNITHQK